MDRWKAGSQFFGLTKMSILSVCILGLLGGCNSHLRTTVVSGKEAPKPEVVQLHPEPIVEEDVVAPVGQPSIGMDIPVEEPARPAPRRQGVTEIFATPKTSDTLSDVVTSSEVSSPLISQDEPAAPSLPLVSKPATTEPTLGIPPIVFEPEMPALPKMRERNDSSTSPELPTFVPQPEAPSSADRPSISEPSAEHDPIQMAKVMPEEPAREEIITETLEVALRDIYFDYDQFSIRSDAVQVLKDNAQLLSSKLADHKIIIQGHCDERGTQSYNMVLGEARAKAVKKYLEDLGISGDKLAVVSYGKDKPFCHEQTEDCWQENRRGHFVIQ